MADSVVLKISFEDQLRRTQLVQPLTIAQVREQISRLFPNVKYFTLSYLDEEGDKITVSSDIELQEAHRVCHPNIRLTLEKLDHPTNSSFSALPSGSLLDHVSPSLNPPPAEAPAAPSAGSLLAPVGSLLNYLSPSVEEDEELQKQLEAIYLQEKEEKEAKEKAEREENERRERERREREEHLARERLEKEKAEKERLERIEREERERQELERKEREVRELLEKLEQEKKLREEQERLEKERSAEQERLEKEKQILEQQRNSREQDRERILQSNESCGEILERLLSEGVELELAWQALEFSNYSNEKRARDLLKMNELGLDFRKASDALTRFNGNVEEAIESLME